MHNLFGFSECVLGKGKEYVHYIQLHEKKRKKKE